MLCYYTWKTLTICLSSWFFSPQQSFNILWTTCRKAVFCQRERACTINGNILSIVRMPKTAVFKCRKLFRSEFNGRRQYIQTPQIACDNMVFLISSIIWLFSQLTCFLRHMKWIQNATLSTLEDVSVHKT